MLNPLMFVGTGSDVGKSIITTAFCRIFKQDGLTPAPFKAQNMSLNSYVTPDGLEIGRAQAVQAEAAGIPCHTDMNPVLLKPTSHLSSQVVLHGNPIGNQSAYEYFRANGKEQLFEEVKQSFDRLKAKYNPVVMEGAGSISELNLKDRDIVNMRMAVYAKASVILVADIDRGGVFASAYGSIKLLPEHEQKLVKGIIVNKFRGDVRLFEDGVKILENITNVPVLGVVPYLDKINIENEDSVALDSMSSMPVSGKLNVCVVHLPHLSNYTDFDVFQSLERVHLYFSFQPKYIQQADIIVLPGTKNSMDDLKAVHEHGVREAILEAERSGKTVIGICGGYQMLGKEINDPLGVETVAGTTIEGIGLFPVTTTLTQEKETKRKAFYHRESKTVSWGYEIHMGKTSSQNSIPVNKTTEGEPDGCWRHSKCWGTYMHGIFDNESVLRELFSEFDIAISTVDRNKQKEDAYDRLAQVVRDAVNIHEVYKILGR